MTAKIDLDSAMARSATVNGIAASKAPGVSAVRIDGNRIELMVGSGKYQIRAQNPAH